MTRKMHCTLATLIVVSMMLPFMALRVNINGKTAGLPQLEAKLHQPIKLPVWPVWSGVIAQCFDWIKLPQLSELMISSIGGRVVPITLSNLDVSPFLLLAHHSHSFTPLDPVRAITKFVLPEGFPAHPHSGFDTVTYCIEGGLRHRDSEKIKMSYGDGDVQWMRAGRGVIHEEMWDLVDAEWAHKRIEIFQLWVNLPKKSKNLDPSLHLLKNEDIPNIDCGNGVSVKIISGSVFDCSTTATPSLSSVSSERAVSISQGLNPETERDEDTYSGIQGPGSDVSESPVSILHINLAKPSSVVNLSVESDCTVTVYVRRGSLLLGGQEQGEKEQGGGGGESQEVRPGDVVVFRISPEGKQYLSQGGSSSSTNVGGRDKSNSGLRQGPGLGVVTLSAGLNGLDALVLCGKPLNEPVIWQGPLVMADEESYRRSAETFNSISRQGYWDYQIPDSEWAEHCEKLDLQNVISASNSRYNSRE